jgi:hypothetical protein
VYPPQEVLEANKMGNAEISEMMFRTLDGETQALMKNVAFNSGDINLLRLGEEDEPPRPQE